jgi:hypothetical protein
MEQKPKQFQFTPVDLKKALLNKPKKSKISFKGLDDQTLQFVMPERGMLYEDYYILFILGGGFCVSIYLTYYLAIYGDYGWFGYLIPLIIWAGLIYGTYQEYHTFKQRQILEISKRSFIIKNIKKGKEKVEKISLDEIILFKLASFSASVIYLREEKEIEAMFMEYVNRNEQQWLIVILRTIVYNVTKNIV